MARAYRERIANDVDEFKRSSPSHHQRTYFCRERDKSTSCQNAWRPVSCPPRDPSAREDPERRLLLRRGTLHHRHGPQERYGESCGRLFDVTGVDIDQEALAKARGRPVRRVFLRGVPEGMRSRYFDRSGKMCGS